MTRGSLQKSLSERSGCVQGELVAVHVGKLDTVSQGAKAGGTERDEPVYLPAEVISNQVEALPVRPVLGFDRRAAPRDLRAAKRRLYRGLLVLVSYQRPAQCVAPEQADIPGSATGDLAQAAGAGQKAIARPDHTELVPTRVGEHDEVVIGLLTHVDMPTSKAQHRFNGPLLVRQAATGQVEVQESRSDLFSVRGHEPEPHPCLVTRHQCTAGLYEDIPIEQPGPERRNRRSIGHVEGHRLESQRHLSMLGRSRCPARSISTASPDDSAKTAKRLGDSSRSGSHRRPIR